MPILSTDQSSGGDTTVLYTSDNYTLTIKSGVVVENTKQYDTSAGYVLGSAVASGYAGNQLNNNGEIYSRGYGVNFDGVSIVNNSAGGVISARYGLSVGGGSVITNDGDIRGTDTGISIGLNETTSIYNSGSIYGGGSFGAIFSVGGVGGGLNLVNDGVITGRISGNAHNDIQNYGTINGDVSLSSGVDTVVNGGRIVGDVGLGFGADTFDGRGGVVTGDILGGESDDRFYVSSIAMANQIVEFKDEGSDTLFGGFSMNLASFSNIENLTLLGSGRFNLTGDAGANVLTGNAGVNTLTGGAGDDTYYIQNAGDRVVEAANGGVDAVHTTVSFTLGANQENLFLDSGYYSEQIRGVGNALDNRIIDDRGGSILDGGAGADFMSGGAGSDTYYVDNVSDVVAGEDRNAPFGSYDTLYTSVSFSVFGQFIEKIVLQGTTGLSVTGSNSANEFFDTVGADTLIGRGSDDVYHVRQAADVVVEAAGGGTDTLYTSVSYALRAGQAVERLKAEDPASTAALNLTGNDVDITQALTGNAGANVLDGRGGANLLTGLGGADTFVFRMPIVAGNEQRIADFSHADDTIRLSQSVFTGLPTGQLPASYFAHADDTLDANDKIIYSPGDGRIYYDADGNGGNLALLATLTNRPADLDASDFFIV